MAYSCACGHSNPDVARFCERCGQPLRTEDDSMIGQVILETYRLEQVLGRGGMSVVYRGVHVVTDQEVAVKVLPPELAGYSDVKARFIEEARTLGRLEHPNIVQLYNFLEAEGHLYLIMQFAEGESFEDIITNQGRVSLADTVTIGTEVLKALEYAHERGVVHRDIKPSNIVIRGDSAVKVMDFGIAKIVGSSKLTQTGQTMGTVRYMSPEQVRGKQVDHRSDLYSLGVTLYAAVCGRTPFDGDNHFDIMRQHLTELPPPPEEFVPVPEAFSEAILKSMQKRAENRYQSAREFRHALQRVPVDPKLRQITSSVPLAAVDEAEEKADVPKKRRRARRRRRTNAIPVLVAALLILGAGGAVLWALMDTPPKPRLPEAGGGRGDAPKAVVKAAWPKLHPVAKAQTWKVDRKFDDVKLRVLSINKIDADKLHALYRRATAAYRTYLEAEGMRLTFKIGALNLALVPQTLLNDRQLWPTAKPNVDYPTRYLAPSSTLYVQDGPRMMSSDLPYGLGLHFCARIRQLSNQRCYELAEGFEKHLNKTSK